jgi:hypothetical protein
MKPMSHLDYECKTVGLTIRERSITPMTAQENERTRGSKNVHRIFSAS